MQIGLCQLRLLLYKHMAASLGEVGCTQLGVQLFQANLKHSCLVKLQS